MKAYLKALGFGLLALLLGWLINPNAGHAQVGGGASGILMAQSTVAEACHVFATRPVVLYSGSVASGAAAGFLMIFDATSAPSDGTVTPYLPTIPVAATSNAFIGQLGQGVPIRFSNGLVMCYSTTGQFTKTASATAFFGAQFQ